NQHFGVKKSLTGTFTDTGIGSTTSARPAPGDFDGDGSTDVAVFDAGAWSIIWSSDSSPHSVSWGSPGDIPVTGDYDGDGYADEAIFRPSTNVWWVKMSNGSCVSPFSGSSGSCSASFGATGDIPVTGNFD